MDPGRNHKDSEIFSGESSITITAEEIKVSHNCSGSSGSQ